jgi:hypothetical protein
MWIYLDDTFNADGSSLTSSQDSVTIISSFISNSQKNISFNDSSELTLSADGSSWTLEQFTPAPTLCSLSPFPGIAGDTISKITGIPLKINGYVYAGKIIVLLSGINTSVTVPIGSFSCSVYEIDIFVGDTIALRTLIYVSGSAGVVQKEYYAFDPKSGNLYLSERKRLIYLK